MESARDGGGGRRSGPPPDRPRNGRSPRSIPPPQEFRRSETDASTQAPPPGIRPPVGGLPAAGRREPLFFVAGPHRGRENRLLFVPIAERVRPKAEPCLQFPVQPFGVETGLEEIGIRD